MTLKPFHLLFYNKPTIIRLYFFCFVACIVVLFDISTLEKKDKKSKHEPQKTST